MEQTGTWAEQRRYMGLEVLAKARRSTLAADDSKEVQGDYSISSQRSRCAVFIHHERGRGHGRYPAEITVASLH